MQLAPQRRRPTASGSGSGSGFGAAASASGSTSARNTLASLYTQPPTGPLTLEELEDFAFDRLELLRHIDNMRAESVLDLPTRIADVEGKFGFRTSSKRKDELSHFTLRLAFCRSPELRQWFCKNELDLFRSRFICSDADSQAELMRRNQLNYERLSQDEKSSADIEWKLRRLSPMSFATETFFVVPFEKAVDLICRHRVLVQRGRAYVPRSELISLVCAHFRDHLNYELAVAFRASRAQTDVRVSSLVQHIAQIDIGVNFKSSVAPGSVLPEDISRISQQSFPLCMQTLHDNLLRDSHLRYGGRQQFGLFLKGIGLSLDHALHYFRRIFSRKSGTNFDKAYAYNIRHNYGKEGKRADYTPFSCAKIINGNAPAQGDHHGCPFRHYDERNLDECLKSRGVSQVTIQKILGLVASKHYQIACKEYFSAMHAGRQGNKVGNHPNEYFASSIELLEQQQQQQQPQQQDAMMA